MGNVNVGPISDAILEIGGADEFESFTIWTEGIAYSCQNKGGIH